MKKVQKVLERKYHDLFTRDLADYLSRGWTVVPGTMHCNPGATEHNGSFIVVVERFE
jgi:hypothetical protein